MVRGRIANQWEAGADWEIHLQNFKDLRSNLPEWKEVAIRFCDESIERLKKYKGSTFFSERQKEWFDSLKDEYL